MISTHGIDNLCQNTLDLINGKLTFESHFPYDTYCQWLISAIDDEHYVNLEFQHLDVSISFTEPSIKNSPMLYLILLSFHIDHKMVSQT